MSLEMIEGGDQTKIQHGKSCGSNGLSSSLQLFYYTGPQERIEKFSYYFDDVSLLKSTSNPEMFSPASRWLTENEGCGLWDASKIINEFETLSHFAGHVYICIYVHIYYVKN